MKGWQRSPIAAAGGRETRCWLARCVKSAMGLLPAPMTETQGSLAKARQPWAVLRSPVGAGMERVGMLKV